jgi:diguanylate cyclase (GGDEF)-like protein/PAS domain S-box-containing protein
MKNLHPADRAYAVADTVKLFQGELASCSYRFLHKNGSELWIHDEQKLVCNEEGKITHIINSWTDITNQKMAEQGQGVSELSFDLHEGILVTDANAVIQKVNPFFTRITGYNAEDAIGKKPSFLGSGQQDAMFFRSMWYSIRESGFWQGEIINKRKNGETFSEWLSITAIKNDAGITTNYVGTFHDNSERKKLEERMRYLAFYDPLTKLPNRCLLMDCIKQAIATNARTRTHGALLFLDLDQFKLLNDTYGHDIGDLLLLEVAERLQCCVREGDTIARLGGDEFVLILNSLDYVAAKAETQAKKWAEKIRLALSKPYHFSVSANRFQSNTITYHSSASIGIVLFWMHGSDMVERMQYADMAMYEAKHAGRDAICLFNPDMKAEVIARACLVEDLHQGLVEKQFLLYYQPQVDIEGRVTGSEALLRWKHPHLGILPPLDFIPLAEENGLIQPLGRWMLETACTQLSIWGRQQETAHLTLAVNVSAHQFHQADFVGQVLKLLDHTGANPGKLKLELPESMLVSNVEEIIDKMTTLKGKGISFSLTDFGAGFSPLLYLKRLPLDQLKIDQGFVRDILTDSNDAAISRMIVVLAETMGLSVIAEGVETEAQRCFLAHQGCHAYQGYLFSHPLTLEEFDAFVRQ